MFKNYFKFYFILFSLTTIQCYGQDRFIDLENQLKELSKQQPGLNENIEISVNEATIQDFLRGIADANNLNISVDPNLTVRVSSNFKDVSVIDILIFLCKRNELDLKFIGSIINVSPYILPPQLPTPYVTKKLNISYNKLMDLLSFDLTNDSLPLVAKEITKLSGKNIICTSDLSNRLLNGYVQDLSFDLALQKLCYSNNLNLSIPDDNTYQIDKKENENTNENNQNKLRNKTDKSVAKYLDDKGLYFKLLSDSIHFSISANNVSISDLIEVAANQLNVSVR